MTDIDEQVRCGVSVGREPASLIAARQRVRSDVPSMSLWRSALSSPAEGVLHCCSRIGSAAAGRVASSSVVAQRALGTRVSRPVMSAST